MSTALFPFNHNDLIIFFFHTIPFFLTIVVVMVWRGWGQTGGSKPPAFRSLHSRFLPFFPYLPHLSPFLIAKYWPFPSISPTSQPFRTHTFCPFLLCLLFFWVPPPPIFFPHNVSSSSRGGGGEDGEGCLKYPRMPSSHALVDFITELHITCTFNFLLALNFFISSTESWRWILWGTSRFYANNI